MEKIAISSIVHEAPLLITQVAKEFGSQSIVVVIDVKVNTSTGKYQVFINNGLVNTGKSPTEFASRVADLGAGEIVINSIDLDGKMS